MVKLSEAVVQRSSLKTVSLEISQNSQYRDLCQGLFFNKVEGFRPATLLKKRLWHKCFPVHFAKFLRAPLLKNTSGGCFWAMSRNIHQWLSKFIFNWELLVTDNARSISKHMLLLKGFLYSLGVTLNVHE